MQTYSHKADGINYYGGVGINIVKTYSINLKLRRRLKIAPQLAIILLWLFSSFSTAAQADKHAVPLPVSDTVIVDTVLKQIEPAKSVKNELDFKDIVGDIIHKRKLKKVDSGAVKETKIRISAVPAAGYSLATGFAVLLAGNAAFHTNKDANTSTMVTSFTYTVRNQIILPLLTNIWTKDNNYNIVTDWRYLKYPSYTYGLGGYTTLDDGYLP